jgi:hypothetical protein
MIHKQQEKNAIEHVTENQALQPVEASTPQLYKPDFPGWPTSKPGPTTTPPPPGMKPINSWRREQVRETDQASIAATEAGSVRSLAGETPDVSVPIGVTAQEALHRRKKRL